MKSLWIVQYNTAHESPVNGLCSHRVTLNDNRTRQQGSLGCRRARYRAGL